VTTPRKPSEGALRASSKRFRGDPGKATNSSGAFKALSLAIVKGFVRDKTSVFFAVIFPLMFLVLFGGLFADQSQSKVDLIEVGDVSLVDDLPKGADAAFEETFHVEHSDNLDDAIHKVRKGDADVAIEMQGDTLVAHYTQTDQVKAAITQGALRAFVDGTNVALLSSSAGEPATYDLKTERVEDQSLKTIQYYTPGLLGWAVAMSASFGAAATIQGWRQSKLIRRLQLAPVSTQTVVGARVAVTIGIALVQMAIFVGLAAAAFGLTLTGSWWMAVPLLIVGTLCFMAIGLLAGAITKTTEGAVNAANFMVLPMSFLSGSFFPLDGSPAWLRAFSNLLPLKHLNDGMLDVMVRGEGPSAALVPMVILLGFAVVVTAVAARLFRWETV
jgi:ABC-2 type transport system permease protein